MYPSLMGTFNCLAPILMIGSSLGRASSSLSSVPFHISHLEDPWTLPSPSTSDEDPRPVEMDMPLSTTLVAYKDNIFYVVDPSPSSSRMEEEDPYTMPSWEVASSHSHDCFNDIFLMNEVILKAMSSVEQPW